MAQREHFCELDLGPNGIRRFDTAENLVAFFEAHRTHYEWIGHCQLPNPHLWPTFTNQFNSAIKGARQWASDPAQEAASRERFRVAFVAQAIPLQGSPRYEFIEELRVRRGEHTAAYALATLAGLNGDLSSFDAICGAVEIVTFDVGLSPHTLDPVKRALEKSRETMRGAANRAKDAERDRENQFQKMREEDRRRFDVTRRWDLRRISRLEARSKAEAAAAVNEIQLVQKQYTELMRLKAPVDYWQEKATEHEAKAVGYRANVKTAAIYGGAAVFVVLALVTLAAIKLPPGTPIAAYASLAAFGALTTTAVLWLVRILVRLFLSQHHLALDARERATMALTYLALTGEGKAEEKDRTLVLTSLFRPTSDGIVKDDAAPDVGLSGLLSKALSK